MAALQEQVQQGQMTGQHQPEGPQGVCRAAGCSVRAPFWPVICFSCGVLGRWHWWHKQLNKLVRKASSVVAIELDGVEQVTEKMVRVKIKAIMDDLSHPLFRLVLRELRSTFSQVLQSAWGLLYSNSHQTAQHYSTQYLQTHQIPFAHCSFTWILHTNCMHTDLFSAYTNSVLLCFIYWLEHIFILFLSVNSSHCYFLCCMSVVTFLLLYQIEIIIWWLNKSNKKYLIMSYHLYLLISECWEANMETSLVNQWLTCVFFFFFGMQARLWKGKKNLKYLLFCP